MPFIGYYLKEAGEPVVEDGIGKIPLIVESHIIPSELKDAFLKTFENIPLEKDFFNFLNSKL